MRETFEEYVITSVFLLKSPTTERTIIYYCPYCRSPILQYQGAFVMEIPGGVPETFPLIVKCKNKECNHKYHFHTLVNMSNRKIIENLV
jgi:hypothetical protein